MTTQATDRSATRILLICASLVVLVAGLRASAPVLLPVFLALFLTILSLPLLYRLKKLGVRFGIAYMVTVLIVLAILSGLGFLISGRASEFVAAAPGYLEELVVKVRAWTTALEERNIPVSDWLTLGSVDPTSVVNVAGGILGGTVRGVASAVSFLTLVLLTMAFMLAEAAGFWDKLVAAFGAKHGVLGYLSTVGAEIERYLAIKTSLSAATGIALGLWVAVLGVPFPLLWALVAFLLNYIPNIGSVVAAVPPVLVALVQFGVGRATLVAIGYLVVNFVVGNVVEPRWMGRSFGLSTLVVFLSLIFWGWLWGPLGMLLSVPLSVMVKIMLENSGELKWAAVLLGPSPNVPEQSISRRSEDGRKTKTPPS